MKCSHCKKKIGFFESYYGRNMDVDKIHSYCITEYDLKIKKELYPQNNTQEKEAGK